MHFLNVFIMNFRPTKLKLMWSIIITAIIYFLMNIIFYSPSSFNTNLLNIFRIDPSLNSLVTLLIVIVVIYIILSLFQRRSIEKR